MPQPAQPGGQNLSDNDPLDTPDPWAQRIGMSVLGGAAVACVAGVVLVVVHHSTESTTAAITAMSSLGSAAVGGIAGMLTFSARQRTHGSAPGPGLTAAISLSPASGSANGPLTITGSGFSPGETVAVQFNTSPLSSAIADGNGSFTKASTAPSLASASYIVTATGQSSSRVAAALFTIS
jgi:hypothetical protein